MRALDFINEIDWNRNIIFLIIYITIMTTAIIFYLFPITDNYKSAVMEHKKTNQLDAQVANTIEQLKQNEREALKTNLSTLKKLKENLDLDSLQLFVDGYLTNADVRDLGSSEGESDVTIHSIGIHGETQELADIMSLIEDISTLNHSIRIAFPLKITKRGNRFTMEMSALIYTSTRDFSLAIIGQEVPKPIPSIVESPIPQESAPIQTPQPKIQESTPLPAPTVAQEPIIQESAPILQPTPTIEQEPLTPPPAQESQPTPQTPIPAPAIVESPQIEETPIESPLQEAQEPQESSDIPPIIEPQSLDLQDEPPEPIFDEVAPFGGEAESIDSRLDSMATE